MLKILDTED